MPSLPNLFFHPRLAGALAAGCLVIILFSTTASGSSAALATTCSSLTPARTSVSSGSSGTILFNCSGKAAFSVNSPGSDVPVFNLPAGYTMMTVAPHVSGASTCSPGVQLISGLEMVFHKSGNFDYCASYANPPLLGLATFKLTWNKS